MIQPHEPDAAARRGRFFLPGPTEVHPDVLAAMARPVIGHRGSAMSNLLRAVDAGLREVFGTAQPVYVSTSSATGLMEAAVRNGVRQHALCLVNGAFSGRFRDLVTDCGRTADSYTVPWGETHEPDELRRRLLAGRYDAVTVVHSETSTGVLNPLPALGEAVRDAEQAHGNETLLLVDGVTSVGAMEVAPEAWGVDFFLTGSQKALALPPGLAFATASPRMLARAATLPGRGQYFDLLEFDRYARRFETPTTPAVNLIFALQCQLQRIRREGMPQRAARHQAMADQCRAWAETAGQRHGLRVLAPAAHRSPTVTALTLPTSRTGPDVAGRMEQHGYTIGAGYGKLKDGTIRIGHMGEHTVNQLEQLLNTLGEVLQ